MRRWFAVLGAVAFVAMVLAAAPADAASPRSGPDAWSLDRLYRAYFLRDPDPGGRAYWADRMANGMSLSAVSTAFSASPEFRARYGSLDDTGFVRLVYRNVLDRDPDDGGLRHWTGMLAAGRSRGWVMIGFSDSAEYKARTGLWVGGAGVGAPPASTYAWLDVNPDTGEPFRFPSCWPITVAANFTNAPPDAERALRRALASISTATGRTWTYVGTTSETTTQADVLAGRVRSLDQPDRYPGQVPPILVVWDRNFVGDSGGFAGPIGAVSPTSGRWWYVSGTVILNARLSHTYDWLTAILMHELGHVYGLDHPAASKGQVMSVDWSDGPPLVWGAGDLYGFSVLGDGDEVCPNSAAPTRWAASAPAPASAPTLVHQFGCGCGGCVRGRDESEVVLRRR